MYVQVTRRPGDQDTRTPEHQENTRIGDHDITTVGDQETRRSGVLVSGILILREEGGSAIMHSNLSFICMVLIKWIRSYLSRSTYISREVGLRLR